MTKRWQAGIFLALVLVIGGLTFYFPVFPWEKQVLAYLGQAPNWLYDFMLGLTRLGDPMVYILIWIPLILLLYSYDRSLAYELAACLVLSLVLHQGLKFIIQRARPQAFMTIEQGGYSYPSGHATTAIACYYFYARQQASLLARRLLTLLALLIGISRLFVGVHWPSDVFMGGLLGLAVVYLIEDLGERRKAHED